MALPSDVQWNVQTNGSDTLCGGGWSPSKGTGGGVNYSLQAAAQVTCSGTLSGTGTTTLTATGSPFLTAHLGNIIQITGGTLTAGFYCIQTITNANNVVLDRTPGTGSGSTGYIGGALATPGMAGYVPPVAGNTIYIKGGLYTNTSVSQNVSGGCLSTPSGSSYTGGIGVIGYCNTPGDLNNVFDFGAKTGFTFPTIQALSGTATTYLLQINQYGNAQNIILDGNGYAASCFFIANYHNWGYNIKAINFTSYGFNIYNTPRLYRCWATSNTAGAIAGFWGNSGGPMDHCVASNLTCIGFKCQASYTAFTNCIAYNCTSYGFYQYYDNGAYYSNCVAYGNGSDGFSFDHTGADDSQYLSCVSYGNTGYGFNSQTNPFSNIPLFNCFFDTVHNLTSSGYTTLTANPFVNPSAGNFALNNVAGGGALVRGNVTPFVYPGGNTIGYNDSGGIQHLDAGITAISTPTTNNQLRSPMVTGSLPGTPTNQFGRFTVNAAANWLSLGFVSEQSKTLNAVRVYCGTLTGTLASTDLSCSIYTDNGTGQPSSTILSTTSTSSGWATGTWVDFTGLSQALTAGTLYHAVIKNNNATPTSNYCTLGYGYSQVGQLSVLCGSCYGWSATTSTNSGSSWGTSSYNGGGYRLKYSDGTYDGMPAQTSGYWSSIYGTFEYGCKFTTPNVAFNLRGVTCLTMATGAPTGTPYFKVYQGATSTLIATSNSFPPAFVNSLVWMSTYFSSDVILQPNTTYRITLADSPGNTDTSSNYYRGWYTTWDPDANSLSLVPLWGTMEMTVFNGSWTDTANLIPGFGLLFDTYGEVPVVSQGYYGF